MKSHSLKKKILFSVVIALSLVIVLLSWQSYLSQKEQLQQSSLEQVQRLGSQQAHNIQQWFAVRENIIKALGSQSLYNPLNPLKQAQVSGDFELTYFGSNDGVMYDSDPSINRDGYDPRSRGWYQEAMNQGGLIVTKPYVDVAYNILVVTLAQSTTGGVVGGDLPIAGIVDDIERMALPADGYAVLMHKDGTVIAYKNAGKAMRPAYEIDNDLSHGLPAMSQSSNAFTPAYFESESREKLLWGVSIPDTDWELVLVLDRQTLEAPLSSLLIKQLGLSLIILIASVLAISALVNILLGPLSKVSQALAKIADGNGDLTQRIEVESDDEVGVLAESFNRFVGSQHELITHIRQLATELDLDAERSLNTNQAAVQELQRQQQEVAMVATAVTEMSCATQEIASNAENTATAAQQSSSSSEQGKNQVDQTRHSINSLASEVTLATEVIGDLSQHAQSISGILSTIQGIAEQTNLLALNAAIEAARAGEQGRGFAVVADEVRVLSRRTQDSTQEIHATIETLQQMTARAVQLMKTSQELAGNSVNDADEAALALEEITQAVSLISDMAGQIATAAEEQTQVTAEITQNTIAIKDVTDDITGSAMDTLEHAQQLKQRANDLNTKVATFIL
ncbi:methyl-accepting chemotaxis protein [Shewanella woodyi]|uniref:Methyl-accepting chemotaxis sensory transducer with Cache sensor n=1 Tax=Shewanella woodyi (strain ATCC 51908 / MS32) TaxID=392500 RepID=B1KN56_SHEWM|nr:methyl-accepting chemotaxis protein [Shewanella woodyi]ACA84553.1 methyl-accepting chemotaxis sensory transducer with Cache sensor [Shewanella woodyi ATCC 51908]